MSVMKIAATTLVAAGLTCGAVGAAHASGTKTLTAVSPRANTMVITYVNTDTEATSCSAYGNGPVYFGTPTVRIPPKGSTTVTVADVPAGFYNVGWGCRGFAQEKHYVTVGGAAKTSAQPHVVANSPIVSSGVPFDLNAVLRSFGS